MGLTENILTKAGVHSEKCGKTCLKGLMNVSEAREVLAKWRLIVSAYLNGNRKALVYVFIDRMSLMCSTKPKNFYLDKFH